MIPTFDTYSFDFLKVEKDVSVCEGAYKGLGQEALLTSLDDFITIFKDFPDADTFIDLGCGYGLGPLIFSQLYPDKKSIGIEFESARFKEALKLKAHLDLKQVQFIHGDLFTCDIPFGDLYFLYFPTGPVLDRILKVLGERSQDFHLIVIESHGDLISRLARETWLIKEFEINLSSQRHYPNAIVFKKIGLKRPTIHDLSFASKFLVIQEEDGKRWVGESDGLHWIKGDLFNLIIPPRSIAGVSIVRTLDLSDFESSIRMLLQYRRQGPCVFQTINGQESGFIRKIYIDPDTFIELSSGKLIPLGEIQNVTPLNAFENK